MKKGECLPGSWRDHARRTIQRVVAANPSLQDKPDRLKKLIDAAYPFGERKYAAYPFGKRKYTPYKIWLAERKAALRSVYPLGDSAGVPCPACGAGVGRACIGIGDDDVAATLSVASDADIEGRPEAPELRRQAVHIARLNRAGLALPGVT